MSSGAHLPHVHTVPLLGASLSFWRPKVQWGSSYNGGMGCPEGSTRLWEPRGGTDPALAVREDFLAEERGIFFSRVFEDKEKFAS